VLKIVTAPQSILSQSAKQISKVDKTVLELVEEMSKTLLAAKDPEGVGLAAPQVGKSLQLFITKQTPKAPIQVFINPSIALNNTDQNADERPKKTQRKSASRSAKISEASKKLEGCLSLPNIWGEVIRDPKITISYLDEKGNSHTKTFKGLFATIVQHEIDHLNGILFPKRVLEQKGILYKSRKDEKNEDVFEEIEV
jgi:peptide deformylase